MGYAEAIEQQMVTCRVHDHAGPEILETPSQYAPLMMALREGEPYFVSADIADVVNAAAATLPPYTLVRDHLPSTKGFMLLERPIFPITLPDGDIVPTTAIAWAGIELDEPPYRRGVMLFTLTDPNTMTGYKSMFPGFHGTLSSDVWMFGDDRWASQDKGDPDLLFDVQPWFAALLLFMQQKMIVASLRPVSNRQTRKRLARQLGHVPLVKVVELRRREYQQRDESHDAHIEYTCQWLVRGHWRQQYFPASGEHRPLWIAPHIKGPSDKPLKAPTITAYEVVR